MIVLQTFVLPSAEVTSIFDPLRDAHKVFALFKFGKRNVRCCSSVFLCPLNCDTTFKITNRLKVNNDNLKFNSNFKSHIKVRKTSRAHSHV